VMYERAYLVSENWQTLCNNNYYPMSTYGVSYLVGPLWSTSRVIVGSGTAVAVR
jgi:hypothetical protein